MTERLDHGGSLRPLLVLVSGAPATGKTTLARRLSEALPLPLLAKDRFREIVADAFEVRSRAESETLIGPTFAIYLTVLDDLLAAGIGAIAECNFFRGVAERDLRPLTARACTVIIHCQTTRELSIRRFVGRFEEGGRHPCFFDGERVKQIRAGQRLESWDRAEPLELGVPTLCVDTADGYVPNLNAIVTFIRSAGDAREPTVR